MRTPTEKKIRLGTIAMIQNSDMYTNGDPVIVYQRNRYLEVGSNLSYRYTYRAVYGQLTKWKDREWEIELRTGIFTSDQLHPLSYDPNWVEVAEYAYLHDELMEDIRKADFRLFSNVGRGI